MDDGTGCILCSLWSSGEERGVGGDGRHEPRAGESNGEVALGKVVSVWGRVKVYASAVEVTVWHTRTFLLVHDVYVAGCLLLNTFVFCPGNAVMCKCLVLWECVAIILYVSDEMGKQGWRWIRTRWRRSEPRSS